MLTLEVQKRASQTNLNKLRKNGRLPAVFYGRKEKSTPISVPERDFLKVWREAGETGVVSLTGEIGDTEVLINEVQLDPLKNTPRHVDFYVIEKGQKVKVKVPLEFIGIAAAIKELGGTLVKVLHEIEVEAEPRNLPKNVEVDISILKDFQSQVLVKDLKLPAGASFIPKAEEVVALAVEAKEIEEEKPTEPVDLSEIAISEKRGKEETGVGESAESTPVKGSEGHKAAEKTSEKK